MGINYISVHENKNRNYRPLCEDTVTENKYVNYTV